MSSLFEMEIKGILPIAGKDIGFKGRVLQGMVQAGDKVEFMEDDGTRVSATVTRIMENKKLFGLFNYQSPSKEISIAIQGQEVSILVSDLYNIRNQSEYSLLPTSNGLGILTRRPQTKVLRTFSGS